ncbi:ventral anterior homeobox 2-like [Lynx canadensis]|uniref:ventral anterior homeobox 2-like n=1 Tax=Lynx canadensis TaxID=61383 RepID=UPI0011B0E17D|nr:ventral anterior homeobox 2-like [Lynx canadensis]
MLPERKEHGGALTEDRHGPRAITGATCLSARPVQDLGGDSEKGPEAERGPPSARTLPRPRKKRTVYLKEQLQELERHFWANRYPSYRERVALAAGLNLDEHQVQVGPPPPPSTLATGSTRKVALLRPDHLPCGSRTAGPSTPGCLKGEVGEPAQRRPGAAEPASPNVSLPLPPSLFPPVSLSTPRSGSLSLLAPRSLGAQAPVTPLRTAPGGSPLRQSPAPAA